MKGIRKKPLVEPSSPHDEGQNTSNTPIVPQGAPRRRVLIFSLTYFPRFVAGAEIAVKEITKRFSPEDRFDFDMITLRIDRNAPKEEVIEGVHIHRIGYTGSLLPGERTIPFPLSLNKYLFPFWACIKALSLHITQPFDLTWSIMANYAGFAALFFKWSLDALIAIAKAFAFISPVAPKMEAHSGIARMQALTIPKFLLTLQEGDPLSHIAKRVGPLWFLYKAIYKNADHIQAISHHLSLMAREVGYMGDVTVISNGVDGERFATVVARTRIEEIRTLWDTYFHQTAHTKESQVAKEEATAQHISAYLQQGAERAHRPIYIISTSRLVLKNAVDDIVRALTFLPEEVRLVAYGVGPDQIALEQLAKKHGVTHRIYWHGFIEHDRLPELLQAADIFVRPSLSEGFGNSFIEAMAAGIPVVGTAVGGIADFLTDENGYIVQPRHPESIAQAISHIIEHPRIAARKVNEAQTLALSKYDWKRVVADMKALFESMFIKNKKQPTEEGQAAASGNENISTEKSAYGPLRFFIATGIYPPDIGGPAQYAKQLTESLRQQGYPTEVASFTFEKKMPTGIRHLFYFFKIIPQIIRADVVIGLDTFSAALPAMFAARLFRRPFMVRTGGDFLWEGYVERTGHLILLKDFYGRIEGNLELLSLKEKEIFRGIRMLFAGADAIVWSTNWQRDIFARPYGISVEKSFIVENAYGQRLSPRPVPEKKVFFAATRPLKWKNADRLRIAFEHAKTKVPDIELALDIVPDHQFLEALRASYAVILPSLGDISPNTIMNAIRCGVPFIVTRETGIYERIKECAIFVDPENTDDIERAIIWLSDPHNYAEQSRKVAAFAFTRTYDDIAADMVRIARTIVR